MNDSVEPGQGGSNTNREPSPPYVLGILRDYSRCLFKFFANSNRLTAISSMLIFAATTVYALVSIGLLSQTKRAAKAAEEANKNARDTLIVSQRPWIKATMGIGERGIEFTKDGSISFSGQMIFKNIGHSPALSIAPMYAMVLTWKDIFDEPLKKQKKICDNLRTTKLPIDKTVGIGVLYPDEESPPDGFSVGANKEQIASGYIPFPDAPNQYVSPVIVGCVDYRTAFSDEHHQTGFIYQVYRFDPARPKVALSIRAGVNLSPQFLRLPEYFFGGKWAD